MRCQSYHSSYNLEQLEDMSNNESVMIILSEQPDFQRNSPQKSLIEEEIKKDEEAKQTTDYSIANINHGMEPKTAKVLKQEANEMLMDVEKLI